MKTNKTPKITKSFLNSIRTYAKEKGVTLADAAKAKNFSYQRFNDWNHKLGLVANTKKTPVRRISSSRVNKTVTRSARAA